MAGPYPRFHIPNVQVVGILPGTTRDGSRQTFDVQCSNGKAYKTFQPANASKASSAIGQGMVDVIISVNGTYENFEDVVPAGQGAALAPAQPQGFTPAAQPAFGQPAQQFGQPAPAQQFVPAAGFVDNKDAERRRGYAIASASDLLGPLVATGVYLNDEGALDLTRLATDLIAVSGIVARYSVEGPSAFGAQSAAGPVGNPEPVSLPPGVTAEDVARFAQAQGAAVQVGTADVVAPEAPAAEPAAVGGLY